MILDGIVALLLATTIIYCWRLSKRLNTLNAGRKELQKFIQDFNESVERANASIALLKALSQETDGSLRSQIDKARFLANDLAFLSHKANNIAIKLDEHIAHSRAVDPNPMGLKSAGKEILQHIRALADEAGQAETKLPHEWKFPEKQAQARTALSAQDIAPSKKQAMEAALAQIASRKRAPKKEVPLRNSRKVRLDNAAAQMPASTSNVSSVKESVENMRSSLEIKT